MSTTWRPGHRPDVDRLEVLRPPRHRGEVTVVDAGAGRLADLAGPLVHGVRVALAEDPRAVICDLSSVTGAGEEQVDALMSAAGQYARAWPAAAVAMFCREPVLRNRLRQHPMSEHVPVRASERQAVIAATRSRPATTALLELPPSPLASRLARDFVSRTCLDWELSQGIASACLIVSEFVTNGVLHAGTQMNLAVARHRHVLRVAVRDSSSKPLRARGGPETGRRIHGRGLTLVEAVSRAWGVLPTADGGKVVWAVLDV